MFCVCFRDLILLRNLIAYSIGQIWSMKNGRADSFDVFITEMLEMAVGHDRAFDNENFSYHRNMYGPTKMNLNDMSKMK